MANKHEEKSDKRGTGLLLKLVKNDSVAKLFILPRKDHIINAAVIDSWNYPVKPYEIRNKDFRKLKFNKEIHVRRSTKGSPCSDLPEEETYKV